MPNEERQTNTLGAIMVEVLRTGKAVHLDRAQAEPIYSRYFESVAPKIEKIRERQRSGAEIDRFLRLK